MCYIKHHPNSMKEKMLQEKKQYPYTLAEEIVSCSCHGLGIILGIAVLAILTAFSSLTGDPWKIVSSVIFASSMIVLYATSTVYHALTNLHAKSILKKFDHIAIYYLIAGTYTPFLLVNLRGKIGWTIFGIIWGLALFGTVLKLTISPKGTKLWSILLYLIMGWMIIFASKELFANLNTTGLIFLILGGLFYTLGIPFYVWKSKKFTHALWHIFVLCGTMMHFFAILFGCVLAG